MSALYCKECKKVFKSIPYIIYVIVLAAFLITQVLPGFIKLEAPEPNQESYGMKSEEIPELIMPSALKSLYREFSSNNYISYPMGFYKNVKLNEKKQNEMAKVLSQLTGSLSESNVSINESITYTQFLKLMRKADEIIGGGSRYSDLYLVENFSKVPVTYDQALKEYNDIMEVDKITGAYARLFCDYLGIIAALLPVFIAAAMGLKDRKSRMHELVFTRKASSSKVVLSRYLAMLSMMMMPIVIMAVYAAVNVTGLYRGMDMDNLAFIKYSFGWLLPTLMISTAVGMFFTELTESPVAIAIQGIWWFLGLFKGMKQMEGGYEGFVLIPRHNTLGNTEVFLENLPTLLINRIFYVGISVVLVILTILVYELKRRGKLDVYGYLKKMFRHCKNKYKA